MKKHVYSTRAFELLNRKEISEFIYDSMIANADVFCDEVEENDNLPDAYAEVDYDDFDNAEAVDGAMWDDKNFQHYMER